MGMSDWKWGRQRDDHDASGPGASGTLAARGAGSQSLLDRRNEAVLILESYENSGQGWFWATDAEGRLTYLTANIGRQIAADLDSLIGMPFTEMFVTHNDASSTQRTFAFMLTRRQRFGKMIVQAAHPDAVGDPEGAGADALEVAGVADDVIVIAALPDVQICVARGGSSAFRDGGCEIGDECAQRLFR